MIRSSPTRRLVLRMNPIARGFAIALALGSGTAIAAGASAPRGPSAPAQPFVPMAAATGSLPALPTTRSAHDVAAPPRRVAALDGVSHVPKNSIPVTNCDDSGAGSLRDAVLSAFDGDTIDLTNTGCSFITLTTGAIAIGQSTLTLQGPGSDYLLISGNYDSQVLLHTGAGVLYVEGLTLLEGEKYQTSVQLTPARGGCVFSSGSVEISDSVVKYCEAKDTSPTYGVKGGAIYADSTITISYSTVKNSDAYSTAALARGGAIYTPGFLTLDHSVITGNEAKSLSTGARATGGGVEALNGMLSKYSTIDTNDASGPNYHSMGGGVYAVGGSTIENSTISGNSAEEGGGVIVTSTVSTTPITIQSSTISGNNAAIHGGVAVFFDTAAKIANSTIAFNPTSTVLVSGAGLYLYTADVDLESTIIAGNTNNGFGDDVIGQNTFAFTGANNLIQFAWSPVPSDTLTNLDPKLSPLSFNGGPTQTHALSFDSPAVDAGNDSASVSFDQRGPGYARAIGANPDIGAYEANTDDRIFADGFD